MAGLKDTVQVNVQGAILGVQEEGFSFLNEFKSMPNWKQKLILAIAIAIVPAFLISRYGTELFLTQRYGRDALSAQAAFKASQPPVVGKMEIIHNPNNTFSAVVLVTNPNLDLAASGIAYKASFLSSSKQTVSSSTGTIYLLPNEKKYVVFAKIDTGSADVASGQVEFSNIKWQKKINIPEVKLRATDPILSDEANPLTFYAKGSVINDSPYQIAAARIVFLLYGDNNQIIGVSQRDESRLVPYGRRDYVQIWPGLYRSQVKRVQIIPVTNTLDPQNITIETNSVPAADPRANPNSNPF
jgi:hypothetical protein